MLVSRPTARFGFAVGAVPSRQPTGFINIAAVVLTARPRMRTLSTALLVSCASLNAAVVAAQDDVRAEAREVLADVVAMKTSVGLGQVPARRT